MSIPYILASALAAAWALSGSKSKGQSPTPTYNFNIVDAGSPLPGKRTFKVVARDNPATVYAMHTFDYARQFAFSSSSREFLAGQYTLTFRTFPTSADLPPYVEAQVSVTRMSDFQFVASIDVRLPA